MVNRKRKHALIVKNVPKFDDRRKFTRFLNDHDISFSRVKKLSGNLFAEVTFADEEKKKEAREKLSGDVFIKGNRIFVEEPLEKKFTGNDNEDVKPLPACIEDVVTPWHKVPYEEQLERKRKEIVAVLKKTAKAIAKASPHDIPQWVRK